MPKRLLLIGAGSLARYRGACFAKLPEIALAGVVSRTEASAQKLAQELDLPVAGTDVDAVAEAARPDAVVITAVNSEHYRYITWALEHDLDVFVEGPMVVSAAQAEAVVALAQARGRLVEVGFQRRYHPVIARARELVRGGAYGPLVWGEVEFLWHMAPPPGEPLPWYLDAARSGGMAVCHMSYGLNTLRFVLGDPVRVFAAGNTLAFPPEQAGLDLLAVTLMHTSGAVTQIVANFSAPTGFPSGVMKAHCLSGGFSLQIISDVAGTFWEGNDVMEVTPPALAEGDARWGADDLSAQCAAFAQALESRTGLLNPPEDSLFELRLIESALASAQSQQPVDLPPRG
jgi:predicted dehydrogenase